MEDFLDKYEKDIDDFILTILLNGSSNQYEFFKGRKLGASNDDRKIVIALLKLHQVIIEKDSHTICLGNNALQVLSDKGFVSHLKKKEAREEKEQQLIEASIRSAEASIQSAKASTESLRVSEEANTISERSMKASKRVGRITLWVLIFQVLIYTAVEVFRIVRGD